MEKLWEKEPNLKLKCSLRFLNALNTASHGLKRSNKKKKKFKGEKQVQTRYQTPNHMNCMEGSDELLETYQNTSYHNAAPVEKGTLIQKVIKGKQ